MKDFFRKHRPIVSIACIVLLISMGLITYVKVQQSPKTVIMRASFITDFSNDAALVRFSDNVFIGQVIKQTGNKKITEAPETQFNVKVIENIKGNLDGTVTVSQKAGYIGRTLYQVEDDELLVPGNKYLFAGRYEKANNWVLLVPNHGNVQINRDDQIQNFISRYQKAFKEQINSFKQNR